MRCKIKAVWEMLGNRELDEAVCMYVCICMYVYVCICMYVYVCLYICTRIFSGTVLHIQGGKNIG